MNNSYNEEPVLYCKHCLSLNIKSAGDMYFCDDCSGTDIESSSIEEWEAMYMEKYKHSYRE